VSTGNARIARWRLVADVLHHVRRQPDVTRADLVRALGLSSSSATEVTARMRQARLLSEEPAPIAGRGRPTTVFRPHPEGPLLLALELRADSSRWCLVALDGRVHDVHVHRHARPRPEDVLATLAAAVREARALHPRRLRAVSLAAAATIRDGQLIQSATLGWGPVDLAPLAASLDVPLLVGNDATLAGVAEARTGAAAGARTALHLLVGVGIGGSLVVNGHPMAGASGAGGEVGHLPFGEAGVRCPCGAVSCWDLEVDVRALARHLGAEEPHDPYDYARRVLGRAADGDAEATAAIRRVVTALARGTAGLVNLYDPDTVCLGGLAVPLRAAAAGTFDTEYAAGLMKFHRIRPPRVVDAAHGDHGALYGAAAIGLDSLTTEAALADWHDVCG